MHYICSYMLSSKNGKLYEMDENRLDLLEGRVKELKVRLERLEENVELSDVSLSDDDDDDQEKIEDRLELLEGRVAVLKVQNVELRDHLNSVVDMVNSITQLLNKAVVNKESLTVADTPLQPQPTVQQVHDMYQTQPATEEGWDEMTAAIKAAEEYEAEQKLLNTIKGPITNSPHRGRRTSH